MLVTNKITVNSILDTFRIVSKIILVVHEELKLSTK